MNLYIDVHKKKLTKEVEGGKKSIGSKELH